MANKISLEDQAVRILVDKLNVSEHREELRHCVLDILIPWTNYWIKAARGAVYEEEVFEVSEHSQEVKVDELAGKLLTTMDCTIERILSVARLPSFGLRFNEFQSGTISKNPLDELMKLHQMVYGDNPENFKYLDAINSDPPMWNPEDDDKDDDTESISSVGSTNKPPSFSKVNFRNLPKVVQDELFRSRYHITDEELEDWLKSLVYHKKISQMTKFLDEQILLLMRVRDYLGMYLTEAGVENIDEVNIIQPMFHAFVKQLLRKLNAFDLVAPRPDDFQDVNGHSLYARMPSEDNQPEYHMVGRSDFARFNFGLLVKNKTAKIRSLFENKCAGLAPIVSHDLDQFTMQLYAVMNSILGDEDPPRTTVTFEHPDSLKADTNANTAEVNEPVPEKTKGEGNVGPSSEGIYQSTNANTVEVIVPVPRSTRSAKNAKGESNVGASSDGMNKKRKSDVMLDGGSSSAPHPPTHQRQLPEVVNHQTTSNLTNDDATNSGKGEYKGWKAADLPSQNSVFPAIETSNTGNDKRTGALSRLFNRSPGEEAFVMGAVTNLFNIVFAFGNFSDNKYEFGFTEIGPAAMPPKSYILRLIFALLARQSMVVDTELEKRSNRILLRTDDEADCDDIYLDHRFHTALDRHRNKKRVEEQKANEKDTIIVKPIIEVIPSSHTPPPPQPFRGIVIPPYENGEFRLDYFVGQEIDSRASDWDDCEEDYIQYGQPSAYYGQESYTYGKDKDAR